MKTPDWLAANAAEILAALAALTSAGLLLEQRLRTGDLPVKAYATATRRDDGLLDLHIKIELPDWGTLAVEAVRAPGFRLARPTFEPDGFGNSRETGHEPFSRCIRDVVGPSQRSRHWPQAHIHVLAMSRRSPTRLAVVPVAVKIALMSRASIRRTIRLKAPITS